MTRNSNRSDRAKIQTIRTFSGLGCTRVASMYTYIPVPLHHLRYGPGPSLNCRTRTPLRALARLSGVPRYGYGDTPPRHPPAQDHSKRSIFFCILNFLKEIIFRNLDDVISTWHWQAVVLGAASGRQVAYALPCPAVSIRLLLRLSAAVPSKFFPLYHFSGSHHQ
jgi:hypothetical protein